MRSCCSLRCIRCRWIDVFISRSRICGTSTLGVVAGGCGGSERQQNAAAGVVEFAGEAKQGCESRLHNEEQSTARPTLMRRQQHHHLQNHRGRCLCRCHHLCPAAAPHMCPWRSRRRLSAFLPMIARWKSCANAHKSSAWASTPTLTFGGGVWAAALGGCQ